MEILEIGGSLTSLWTKFGPSLLAVSQDEVFLRFEFILVAKVLRHLSERLDKYYLPFEVFCLAISLATMKVINVNKE